MRAVAKQLLKEQGLAGFYRGYGASMLNSFSMQLFVLGCFCLILRLSHYVGLNSAYFYWATVVRTAYIERLYPFLTGALVAPKALSTA